MERRNFFTAALSLLALPFTKPVKATPVAGMPTPYTPIVYSNDILVYARRAGKSATLWECARMAALRHPDRTQAICTPHGRFEVKWVPNK